MPFELQPTLRGELIELRPLGEEDFEELYAAASDPLVWEQHPQSDRYKEEVFRDFFRTAMESGGAFVVTDLESGRVVGSSRFHAYDEERSEIEIGWTFLARTHWGGLYNGEMKRLMIEHAFRFVDSVIFLIGPRNHRSRKAIERVGAVLAGPRFDRGHESLLYRIVKPAPGHPPA